jgi:hypothetical protein
MTQTRGSKNETEFTYKEFIRVCEPKRNGTKHNGQNKTFFDGTKKK